MKEMFLSWLAPQMENMIAYKQALGYLENTYRPHCKNLDRYCLKHFPKAGCLTKALVLGWMERRPGETHIWPPSVKKPISSLISLLVGKAHLSPTFLQMMNWPHYSTRLIKPKAAGMPSSRYCSPRFSG